MAIESDSSSIIVREFAGDKIEFFNMNNKLWLSSSTIAFGLGIDRRHVNRIFQENRELLSPYSTVIKSDDGQRNLRIFDKTGFIGICMRSNSPRALPFQQWVLKVVQEIEEKGFYLEKQNLDPLEVLLQQMDALKTVVIEQLDQKKKLEQVETKILTFEQKYEDERLITPQTRRAIKDLIQECVKNSEKHWGSFWPKIWKQFSITTITDISEKLGQKIIDWIKYNPDFSIYLNEELEE